MSKLFEDKAEQKGEVFYAVIENWRTSDWVMETYCYRDKREAEYHHETRNREKLALAGGSLLKSTLVECRVLKEEGRR